MDRLDIAQFEKVRAIFKPRDTKNLRDTARLYIGRSGVWEAMWVIDHECEYKGQWAFVLREDDRGVSTEATEYFGWVPECDLELEQ